MSASRSLLLFLRIGVLFLENVQLAPKPLLGRWRRILGDDGLGWLGRNRFLDFWRDAGYRSSDRCWRVGGDCISDLRWRDALGMLDYGDLGARRLGKNGRLIGRKAGRRDVQSLPGRGSGRH